MGKVYFFSVTWTDGCAELIHMVDYLDLCTIVYWYVQTSVPILIHMAIIDKSMYYSLLQTGVMIFDSQV